MSNQEIAALYQAISDAYGAIAAAQSKLNNVILKVYAEGARDGYGNSAANLLLQEPKPADGGK